MPTILLKKSDTPGSVPGTANLTNLAGGVEVAVNTADKRVYSMTSASAVIELGTNPSSLTCSDVSATVLRAGSATITNLIATSASITTLTNNPTFSAGTANGVLYLNGSKVATSGSALVFDGTNLGIGTASPASKLDTAGTIRATSQTVPSSGTGAELFYDATNAGLRGYNRTGSAYVNLALNDNVYIGGGSSGNVGIGTASPGAKLHVLGSNLVGIFAGTNANTVYTEYRYNSTTTSGFIGNGSSILSAAADSDFIVRSEGALKFATNGNNFRAVIDSSGNLGLGVTPFGWNSSYKAFDLGSGALMGRASNTDTYLLSNAYLGASTFQYKYTAAASYYSQAAGVHYWWNAPSGTAGDAISFTQAMTLDASGNLLVGTTTPALASTVRAVFNDPQAGGIELVANNSGGVAIVPTSGGGVEFVTFSGAIGSESYTERARISSDGTFRVKGAGTAGSTDAFQVSGSAPASAMTLDASGNLGVGTTSPVSALHIQRGASAAAYYAAAANNATLATSGFLIGQDAAGLSRIYQYGSNPMTFWTNDTERARFTAGGYFKASDAGTYNNSTGAYHELRQTANDTCAYISATNASMAYNVIAAVATRGASSAFNFLSCAANSVDQFYVRGDGVVYAQNTTIQSISDARLKENVRDASEGLNVINALRSVRYDWKEGFGNNRKDQLGFIAQEVEVVFPDAVSEWKAKEGEEAYKTVGPAALIPVLVKAIQELSAKVAALEAK